MRDTETQGGWLVTLGMYAAWFLTALGAVVDTLAIREASLSVLAWIRVINREAYRQAGGAGEDIITNFGLDAADFFLVFILAITAVGFAIWFEYYYRKGREKGLLYKRIGKVAAIEIGIVILTVVIRLIVARFI